MQSILILDDDPSLRQALTHSLQAHQFSVTSAQTAEHAAELVKQDHYDLVLLDFFMPEHDGMWFMQNAKLTKKTKVLLMTGHLRRDVINSMFSLGVSGYMIKPIDEEMLIHNIRFYLEAPQDTASNSSVRVP